MDASSASMNMSGGAAILLDIILDCDQYDWPKMAVFFFFYKKNNFYEM